MRSKEDILKDLGQTTQAKEMSKAEKLVIEVLVDIRDALNVVAQRTPTADMRVAERIKAYQDSRP